MIKQRIFCVISEIYADRQKVLQQIKQKVLGENSSPLNTRTLYSLRLEPQQLSEALASFSFAGKKLIILKDADQLSPECRLLLARELKDAGSINHLVLEIERDPWEFSRDKKVAKDGFFQSVLNQGTVLKSRRYKEQMTFYKLTSALQKGQIAAVFYVLESLFLEYKNDKALGMQLIGTLVRHFSAVADPARREHYLSLVWKADRLIKEKGVEPRLALEMLVTEVCAD